MRKTLLLLSMFITVTSYGAESDCPAAGSVEMANCFSQKLGKADAELKKVFAKAIAYINNTHMPKPERESWRLAAESSQRSWEAHVQTECEEVTRYLWWGGSGVEAAVSECQLEKTRERIRQLRQSYVISK